MPAGAVFFLQLVVTGLVVGAVYSLIALGFVLIYKVSDVINFAQGELLLIGAFIGITLVTDLHLPFLAGLAATMVACALLGWLIERVVLRPFIGEPVISVIMATIGLSYLLRGVMSIIWGPVNRSFPQVFSPQPVMIGPVPVSQVFLWALALTVLLLTVTTAFFKYSRLGVAMRASADDQTAALSMGISVKLVFAVTWAIATVVAGLGGVFLGSFTGVNYMLSGLGLKVLPVVILGGLDSLPGAIIGGFVIGVLENLAGGYLDNLLGGGVKDVFPFVVLVIILMIRPYGLFGKELIERV